MSLAQVAPMRAVLERVADTADQIDDELLKLHTLLERPEITGVSHARARDMLLNGIAPLVRQLKIDAATAPHAKGTGR